MTPAPGFYWWRTEGPNVRWTIITIDAEGWASVFGNGGTWRFGADDAEKIEHGDPPDSARLGPRIEPPRGEKSGK
ncbi:MAG: hypothetical protein JWL84_5125 [Rhodospirillales bacterium]|jgi:hypothetical protein|nr:hypothetical protein [Rhodospirillales bacterium]